MHNLKYKFITITIALILSFNFLSLQAFASNNKKHILVLSSTSNSEFHSSLFKGFFENILDSSNNFELHYELLDNPLNRGELYHVNSVLEKYKIDAIVVLNNSLLKFFTNFENDLKYTPPIFSYSLNSTSSYPVDKNFHILDINYNLNYYIENLLKIHKSTKTINFLINTQLQNTCFFNIIDDFKKDTSLNVNIVTSNNFQEVMPILSSPDSLNLVFANLKVDLADTTYTRFLTPFATMEKISSKSSNPTYGGFKEFGTRFNLGAIDFSLLHIGNILADNICNFLNNSTNNITYTYSPKSSFFINENMGKHELNSFSIFNIPTTTYNYDKETTLYSENKINTLTDIVILSFFSLVTIVIFYLYRLKLLNDKVKVENLKSSFIANISHELRTPLNIITSSISLFDVYAKNNEIEFKTDRSLEKLNYIKKNSLRLTKLINNVIDTTKLEAGFFEVNKSYNNIISVVEDITLSTSPYAEAKNLTLTFDTNLEEVITLFDKDMIERVILNLLSNSYKFTPSKGEVNVNIKAFDTFLEIYVTDTGLGISLENKDKIFEKFIQDKNTLNKNEGSGIGLYLCKNIIDLHHGTISISETSLKGTSFKILLPILPPPDDFILNSSDNPSLNLIDVEFSDQ